jgi:hypothetical protein
MHRFLFLIPNQQTSTQTVLFYLDRYPAACGAALMSYDGRGMFGSKNRRFSLENKRAVPVCCVAGRGAAVRMILTVVSLGGNGIQEAVPPVARRRKVGLLTVINELYAPAQGHPARRNIANETNPRNEVEAIVFCGAL